MSIVGKAQTSDSFNFFSGTGDKNYTGAVNMIYSRDLNGDGIDEILFSGFETQPNTPATYSNTQISIFGWQNGKLKNLTSKWLPNNLSKVEGVGSASFGDFNGDGKLDLFLSGYSDMNFPVGVYSLINTGSSFTRQDLGKTALQHDSVAGDIDGDGYCDVIAVGYGDSPRLYLGSPTGLVSHDVKEFMGASGVVLGDFLCNGTTSMILVDHLKNQNKDTALYKLEPVNKIV